MQLRVPAPIETVVILSLVLTACTPKPPAPEETAEAEPTRAEFLAQSDHSPPFARTPYEPFSRAEVVAIAEQEWRLFGQRVDDDPPHTRPDPDPEQDPNRSPGFWERIGEYWWLGQDMSRRESAWTGMHDEAGQPIDQRRD